MQHSKFQVSELINSKEEDFFKYIFMYFYSLNLGTPSAEPSQTLGFHLNRLGKGPPGNAPYQISSI